MLRCRDAAWKERKSGDFCAGPLWPRVSVEFTYLTLGMYVGGRRYIGGVVCETLPLESLHNIQERIWHCHVFHGET